MTDPCAGCLLEFPGCRRICSRGIAYQEELQKRRDRVKAAKHVEDEFTKYRYDRDYEPKKRKRE